MAFFGFQSSADTGPSARATMDGLKKTPFSAGYTTTKDLLAGDEADLAARQAKGAPMSTAASVTPAAMGTAGASGQAGLAARLKAIWSGGATPGADQAYAANDQAKQAMYASAFGGVGGAGIARAMRSSGNQGALMDAQTARQADILRAQEQQAALAQYGQLGTEMRAGDMSDAAELNKISAANAGFAQQSAFANQSAAMRWQAMNDAQKRALLGMGIDTDQSDIDARLKYFGATRQFRDAFYQQQKAKEQADDARTAQGLMTVVTMGAGGMKYSKDGGG